MHSVGGLSGARKPQQQRRVLTAGGAHAPGPCDADPLEPPDASTGMDTPAATGSPGGTADPHRHSLDEGVSAHVAPPAAASPSEGSPGSTLSGTSSLAPDVAVECQGRNPVTHLPPLGSMLTGSVHAGLPAAASAMLARTADEPAPAVGAVQCSINGMDEGGSAADEGPRPSLLRALVPFLRRPRASEAAALQHGRRQSDLVRSDSATVTFAAASAPGATGAAPPDSAAIGELLSLVMLRAAWKSAVDSCRKWRPGGDVAADLDVTVGVGPAFMSTATPTCGHGEWGRSRRSW